MVLEMVVGMLVVEVVVVLFDGIAVVATAARVTIADYTEFIYCYANYT